MDEPDSIQARKLRDTHLIGHSPLAAPDLLIYEVGNVLLHNSRFTDSEIERALVSLYDLQLDLIAPTAEMTQAVVRLASRYKLTFYDALHVGLAQELGVELITVDRKLIAKLQNLPFIRSL